MLDVSNMGGGGTVRGGHHGGHFEDRSRGYRLRIFNVTSF